MIRADSYIKLKKEDVLALVEETAEITIHAEPGTVRLYTTRGIVPTPYEILGADKAAGSLTLRAVNGPDALEARPLQISIQEGRITVLGGQVPFLLKKIDEDEFKQRKNALPADKVGP